MPARPLVYFQSMLFVATPLRHKPTLFWSDSQILGFFHSRGISKSSLPNMWFFTKKCFFSVKLDVDNFAHRWTFLANFFLNTSTPRDLSIAHVFDGEGVGFGYPWWWFPWTYFSKSWWCVFKKYENKFKEITVYRRELTFFKFFRRWKKKVLKKNQNLVFPSDLVNNQILR